MSKEANKSPWRIGALHLLLAWSISLRSNLQHDDQALSRATWVQGGGILGHQVSVAWKASWRTRFNVQCLMVWCELPHSLIESNQVLPLDVGREPKSASPGQAAVQIYYSWSQFFISEILSHQAAVNRDQIRLSLSFSNPMIGFVSCCVTMLFSDLMVISEGGRGKSYEF